MTASATIDVRQQLSLPSGGSREYVSLPLLEERGVGAISRLPVSLRILLESVVRNWDGQRIRDEDVVELATWQPQAPRVAEVPFVVGRVLLQDFTGVPLLVDLAAMRSAVARRGLDVEIVQPRVPVDLVIDHSVQVDYFARADAFELNTKMELERNEERYRFLKWGAGVFDGLRIVPPGFGICRNPDRMRPERLIECSGIRTYGDVELRSLGRAGLSTAPHAPVGLQGAPWGVVVH